MSAAKLSISLPESLNGFVESYRKKRGLNRSQVFEEAVRLLRSRELEVAYRESAAGESDLAWDSTTTDGLDDEAW
jgi:antitoxin ParD1/3/4